MVVVQLALGATVWVTNFGWPVWFTDLVWTPDYTVVAEGRLQVLAMTAHVAVGSLSLVAALSLALWCRRLVDFGESLGTPAPGKPGR
jgi:hypothetical protein